MNSTHNTMLITGGGSGIGFETAKRFSEQGNKVIIVGRTAEKLEAAAAQLKNVTTIVADVTDAASVQQLVARLEREFPELNIVMNNAASAFVYDLATASGVAEMAAAEMDTNYLSVIRLNEQLLPLLRKQQQAAIINVSSIVALVPGRLVTYSASKAALHSYTQILRLALEETPVKVFELMPPLVNTEFSKPIGGENGVSPAFVAETLFDAVEKDVFEIHVGQTADMYALLRTSPEAAFNAMNHTPATEH